MFFMTVMKKDVIHLQNIEEQEILYTLKRPSEKIQTIYLRIKFC